MKVGKYYKGLKYGTVVRCTTPRLGDTFGGIVTDKARGHDEVGYEFGEWLCAAFEECAPKQALVNGHEYTIPDGCKVIIKNGKVSVEHSVYYKKKKWNDLTRYIMVKPGKNISIDMFGNEFVKITMDINEDSYDCYDRSSKEEFMKNYNKALKALEL